MKGLLASNASPPSSTPSLLVSLNSLPVICWGGTSPNTYRLVALKPPEPPEAVKVQENTGTSAWLGSTAAGAEE